MGKKTTPVYLQLSERTVYYCIMFFYITGKEGLTSNINNKGRERVKMVNIEVSQSWELEGELN